MMRTSNYTNYILGDDFMMNKYVIYQENTISIYPESKCGPITQK